MERTHGLVRDGAQLQAAALRGLELRGCSVVGANLAGADLSGARFIMTRFEACNLRGATLSGSECENLLLESCDVSEARFDLSQWRHVDVKGCALTGATFRAASIGSVKIESSTMHRLEFVECTLEDSHVASSDMTDATGAKSTIRRTVFEGVDALFTDWSGSILEAVTVAGSRFDRAVFHGTQMRSLDAKEASFEHADLRDSEISGSEFSSANLVGVDFSGARIIQSQFQGADLLWSNFDPGVFLTCSLEGARLPAATVVRYGPSGVTVPFVARHPLYRGAVVGRETAFVGRSGGVAKVATRSQTS